MKSHRHDHRRTAAAALEPWGASLVWSGHVEIVSPFGATNRKITRKEA
jgi:hypothetical protein